MNRLIDSNGWSPPKAIFDLGIQFRRRRADQVANAARQALFFVRKLGEILSWTLPTSHLQGVQCASRAKGHAAAALATQAHRNHFFL
jgi:hypothetical protein